MVEWTLELIRQNETLAYVIIALICFGESLAFVSLLTPGFAVMVAAGALVPSGALSLWPLLIAGALGATMGDAVSYYVGLRFKHVVPRLWPFTRHPDWLDRGHVFFNRYGGISVFAGRFFGPVRAVIPLAAGMMEMPAVHFWIANVGSAIVWAPAVVLPGAVVGWSLERLNLESPVVQGVLWGGAALLVALWLLYRRRRGAGS
jgi:membrane protein DedA with SNARE-associated domain